MSEPELDPRVQSIVAELRRPVAFDPAARERLMMQLRLEPLPRRAEVPWSVRLRRHGITLNPLVGAALAAGLVGIGVLVGLRLASRVPEAAAVASGEAHITPVREAAGGRDVIPASSDGKVKFVLVAPQASQVSLVGDFNGWNPAATPMQRTGGTWSIALPLRPGLHVYAFVVNGTHWMPDPAAPLAPEDGFGVSNSVVLVGGSSS